jgi:purine nucleosidase
MPKTIFYEHDGAVEDLLAQLLLLTAKEVNIIGINVIPGNCFIEPGLSAAYKLLHFMGRQDIPLGKAYVKAMNPFEVYWRAKQQMVNLLPELLKREIKLPPIDSYRDAAGLLIERISMSQEKVTILLTGPCSNLVKALKQQPAIADNIAEIIWMAGAFDELGNAGNQPNKGSAEWNVYWDYQSACELLASGVSLTFVPLDITNKVKLSEEFLRDLAKQSDNAISNLASQMLSAVAIDSTENNPLHEFDVWDVLAAIYLMIPERFYTEDHFIAVNDYPMDVGKTFIIANRHRVKIVVGIKEDVRFYYKFLLEKFATKRPD